MEAMLTPSCVKDKRFYTVTMHWTDQTGPVNPAPEAELQLPSIHVGPVLSLPSRADEFDLFP